MTDLLTVPEAAKLTPLSESTLWRMLSDGRLTPYKPPRTQRTFIHRDELEALARPAPKGRRGNVVNLQQKPASARFADRAKAIGGGRG